MAGLFRVHDFCATRPFTGRLQGDRDVVNALDNGATTFTGTNPNGFNGNVPKMTMASGGVHGIARVDREFFS